MIKAIESINRRLYLNSIGEQTQWKQGYKKGLEEAIKYIEDGIVDLVVPYNDYYVIMYHYGDKHFPYIEKMRLYLIKETEKRETYYFSKNPNANRLNTQKPDAKIVKSQIKDRVFFTLKYAQEAIKK